MTTLAAGLVCPRCASTFRAGFVRCHSCSVDLVDLEKADGLALAQTLGGTEILCDSVATRERMAVRLHRMEDDRRSVARAAQHARKGLFA